MNAKYTYYEESGVVDPSMLDALKTTLDRSGIKFISTATSSDSVFDKIRRDKLPLRAGI